MKPKIVDKIGASLANRAVTRYSRRSALHQLATGAAGLFGLGIVMSSVVGLGMQAHAQSNPSPPPPGGGGGGGGGGSPPPCSHGGDCTNDGTWCGLHGIKCPDVQAFDSGNDCNWSNGCPGGTSRPGSGWYACCLCTSGNGDAGEIFQFQDCCGSVSAACAVAIGLYVAYNGRCSQSRCPATQNWCNPYGGGQYWCTNSIGPQGSCNYSTYTGSAPGFE